MPPRTARRRRDALTAVPRRPTCGARPRTACASGAEAACASGAEPACASGVEPACASSIEPACASGVEPAYASGVEPAYASAVEPACASGVEPACASGAEPAYASVGPGLPCGTRRASRSAGCLLIRTGRTGRTLRSPLPARQIPGSACRSGQTAVATGAGLGVAAGTEVRAAIGAAGGWRVHRASAADRSNHQQAATQFPAHHPIMRANIRYGQATSLDHDLPGVFRTS
jgi:hypothetical protein